MRRLLQQQINSTQEIMDEAHWKISSNNTFSVKSAYLRLSDAPRTRPKSGPIWKLQVPPRFKVFAWLLYHNKILTINNLQARGFVLVGMCSMCRNNEETPSHLFNECQTGLAITNGALQHMELNQRGREMNFIQAMADTTIQKKTREVILISNFIIWRERCNRIFNDKLKTVEELIEDAS